MARDTGRHGQAPPSSTLLDVPDNESTLLVPLRSNASTLLTGRPIAAMRRRLKLASVYHDRLLLEAGILMVQVGPKGGSTWHTMPTEQQTVRWQTPHARHLAEQGRFQLAMGREMTPGVLAETMSTFIDSETSICWVATLDPFGDELPPEADWVDFVRSPNSLPGEVGRLADWWSWADKRNTALKQAMPVQFVRDTVVGNANHDLAGAASAGFVVTIDSVHAQVVTQRFRDEEGWRLRGYVVPIVIPEVGELPWRAVADLRRDRNIARFRAVLREVENEAVAEAAGGDIESAAHHAYERHLAEASGKLEGIGGPARRTVSGFVVGATAGLATSGITGPAGILAGVALGTVPGAVLDIRSTIRRRRTNGWVGLYQRITGSG
jgi:hypothetical protein